MPGGLNGIELARRAQALRPDLKVLLTSGYLGDAVQGLSHEFALIEKPYERAQLAAQVRHVLSASASGAAAAPRAASLGASSA